MVTEATVLLDPADKGCVFPFEERHHLEPCIPMAFETVYSEPKDQPGEQEIHLHLLAKPTLSCHIPGT